MKKILIPILALLLLAGGGAGAYFYMGKADAASGEAAVEKADAPALDPKQIAYIPMQPIILPIIDRNGISQTISVVISIQVNNKERAAEVTAQLPKLTDAYLSDMYGTLSKKASMESGVIKVSMLKSRLVEITNKVMGEGVVDGVLLQVLQQHPT